PPLNLQSEVKLEDSFVFPSIPDSEGGVAFDLTGVLALCRKTQNKSSLRSVSQRPLVMSNRGSVFLRLAVIGL
ncbi:hypothetical protein KUCAC02_037661, partial [Chaenocephalus aceratus]